jgi:hypothetical protein
MEKELAGKLRFETEDSFAFSAYCLLVDLLFSLGSIVVERKND